jgi:DNA-binding response OmpR family regulator
MPALILMDIDMLVLNGKELLTMLRIDEEMKGVKIVIYTTSKLTSDNHFAKSLNAGFITKPHYVNELHNLIQKLLIESRLVR